MAQFAVSCVQEDKGTSTETPPHVPERDTEDSDPPWDQPSTASLPSEDTIRENMIKHKKDILEWLNPSQLLELLQQFKLLKAYRRTEREQFVELLIEEVQRRNAYSAFLESLEKDVAREHMGHWYIASLLRGQEFTDEDEIQKSRTLKKKIGENLTQFVSMIDVNNLGPALFEVQLITDTELKDLRSEDANDNAIDLFLLLDTKGPTAHYLLCHKVLAKDPIYYTDLLELLGFTHKKMVSENSVVPSLNCYPQKFPAPKGLQTTAYLVRISKVRQYHQMGGSMWDKAEEICMEAAMSTKHTLEVKIAFLLESCNVLILQKETDIVFDRVKQAAEMCKELHKQCNANALDARRQWILAKYYRCTGKYDKAQQHADTAFRLLANCRSGEEHVLVNYCNGVIHLDKGTDDSSADQQTVALESLQSAMNHAMNRDYGLKIFHYDMIRQAQAHLRLSSSSPQRNNDYVTKQDIEEAKKCLETAVPLTNPDKVTEKTLAEVNKKLQAVDQEEMKPRTWCMFLHTWSDVYRLSGDMEQVKIYAELASQIALKHNFQYVAECIQKRLDILQETLAAETAVISTQN